MDCPEQSTVQKTSLRPEKLKYGGGYVPDNAPFTLWDIDRSRTRDPTSQELSWIRKRYSANLVGFSPPDLLIHTNEPPKPLPLTVAGVRARFVPAESGLKCCIPLGPFSPLRKANLDDLLPQSLLCPHEFPSEEARYEIINELREEVDIRTVHFSPPLVIVELDVSTGRVYPRSSLPGKAGGLDILYYESAEEYYTGHHNQAGAPHFVHHPKHISYHSTNY